MRTFEKLVLLLAFVTLTGCVTTRSFTDPRQRITDDTAYTLEARETRVDVGVLGTGLLDAGAIVGVTGGLGHGFELGANLAHGAFGLTNVNLKYNVVDRRWFGLGLQAGMLWVRPRSIWLLPKDIRDPLRNVDLFIIPLRVMGSVPLTNWASVHFTAGYTHAEVLGAVSDDSGALNGGLGTRTIFVEPSLHIYVADRIALIAGGYLPTASWALLDLEVDAEIEEGVIVSVRSSEWAEIPLTDDLRWHAGVEVKFGRRTYGRLFVTRNLLTNIGIGPAVWPALDFYWRF